jgi:fucose 4-O-acetylase-like acetyltransferase
MARDRRIDSLRTFAVLLVAVGHSIMAPYAGHPERAPLAWAIAFGVIAAINVPLFMFLSGWVSKPGKGVAWVGDRVLRLLVPYVASCAIQFGMHGFAGGLGGFLTYVLHPSSTNALWFLPSLFLCSMAFAAFSVWEPLLIGATVVLVFWTPPVLFFDVWKASTVFPLFAAGYFARRVDWRPGRIALLTPLLVAAVWTTPGVGLQWTIPAWYATWATAAALLPGVAVQAPLRLAHYGVEIALIATAFWVAGFGRAAWRLSPPAGLRGVASRAAAVLGPVWDWMGRNTLGIYLGHIYFLGLYVGSGSVAIVTVLVTALAGGMALAWLAGRSRWTSGLFLGTGFAPAAPPAGPESRRAA